MSSEVEEADAIVPLLTTVQRRQGSPPSPTPRSSSLSSKRQGTVESWRPFRNGITSLTVDIPQFTKRPRNGVAPGNSQLQRPQQGSSIAMNHLDSGVNADDAAAQIASTLAGGQNTVESRSLLANGVSPSRWRTREFCAYYTVFVVAVPCMAKVVIDLSKDSHPNYHRFSHRLRKGWLFGWKVDTSDHQWNTFRSNIPILAVLVAIWTLSSYLYKRYHQSSSPTYSDATTSSDKNSSSIPLEPEKRMTYIIMFAFPLLLILHGSSLPKIFVILWLNFQVSRLSKFPGILGKMSPLIGWTFNLAILFANEIFGGYNYGSLWSGLGWLDAKTWGGILPRWHINWNITMLRLISFNMDYYWACTKGQMQGKSPLIDAEVLDERSRTTSSHPLSSYSFFAYLSYALYPPLYLAGPIITFNSFLSQIESPPRNITRSMIVGYTVRFLACLTAMELVLHSMYVVAIKDESRNGAWKGDTPFELSMIGFWNLIVVWLKLLIPWRFFRLWALLDGMDPPENMVRCMANNYSTLGFWRSWHRSYNLWVVRYLYIPLGGTSHAIAATLAVFTFVALWHDLSLKLLTWGWVISLFVLPEMSARKFVPYSTYGGTWWYRHLAAVGGILNILMMMTANLIGFAIGTEGMSHMWGQMVGSWEGVKFMLIACGCLFVAVQVMFEYREEERRRGIVRRC